MDQFQNKNKRPRCIKDENGPSRNMSTIKCALMGNATCLVVLLSGILVCALLWAQLSRKRRKLQQALLPSMTSSNSRVAKPFIAFGSFKNAFFWSPANEPMRLLNCVVRRRGSHYYCWLINNFSRNRRNLCKLSVLVVSFSFNTDHKINIAAHGHQCNQHFWPAKMLLHKVHSGFFPSNDPGCIIPSLQKTLGP